MCRIGVLIALVACSGISLAEQIDVDEEIVSAYNAWRAGEPAAAEYRLHRLVQREPTFRLAQVMYGDLLNARAGAMPMLAQADSDDDLSEVVALLGEAKSRIGARQTVQRADTLPGSLVSLGPSVKHAIVVDMSSSRLHLYENTAEGVSEVTDVYAGIGAGGPHKRREGDRKTPVGVYFVTQYIDGDELPDLYGAGAYPVNYPNAWDRKLGYSGSGIWLHGVPSDTYSRPPRSSRGCVTMANTDLLALGAKIDIGQTPVILAESIDWISESELEARRGSLEAHIEQWRRDWESLDTDRYLSHYADDFEVQGLDFLQWTAKKRDINSRKTYINVALSDLSLFRYPEANVFIADFIQDYRSNNHSGSNRKRLYWRQSETDGRWQIISEHVL